MCNLTVHCFDPREVSQVAKEMCLTGIVWCLTKKCLVKMIKDEEMIFISCGNYHRTHLGYVLLYGTPILFGVARIPVQSVSLENKF